VSQARQFDAEPRVSRSALYVVRSFLNCSTPAKVMLPRSTLGIRGKSGQKTGASLYWHYNIKREVVHAACQHYYKG
jgi:hypothetical protein